MLGELDSRELDAIRSSSWARDRTHAFLTAVRAHAALAAFVALVTLAAASIAVRVVFAAQVRGPFFFMDELFYEQTAKSIARAGHLGLFAKTGLAGSPLYSILLSPIYALSSSAQAAYEWTKVENAVLMSLAAFPVYGIARFVLSRPRAVGVAALTLAAPLMFYTSLETTESLAFPLFLVAIWAMLRAVRDPSVRNDAILLVAICLACAARLQHVALIPVALTAVVMVALVSPPPGERRRSSVLRAVKAHKLLFGGVGVALVAVFARTLANGGALPLSGIYANVGSARANPLRVLEIAAQHLAELDFAMGIIPLAGAVLAAYALARRGFPRDGLVFASVAVAATAWYLLETAYDAAAFDKGVVSASGAIVGGELPRIHQRYLIYLVPLFLIALVAGLRAARPRVRASTLLTFATAAALLPALIPFSRVVNYTIVPESFGLQIFGTSVADKLAPVSHPLTIALVAGGVFGLAFVYAVVRPRPSFAIVMTVVAFVILGSLVRMRLIGATSPTVLSDQRATTSWVDRAVGGRDVVLVGGPAANVLVLEHTAFSNLSITRVYYTCVQAFGSDFGERQVTIDATGALRDGATALRAPFAVVPTSFRVPGRVLARDRKGQLELVAPAGGKLTLGPGHRVAAACGG